jgi:hypothetical protein
VGVKQVYAQQTRPETYTTDYTIKKSVRQELILLILKARHAAGFCGEEKYQTTKLRK